MIAPEFDVFRVRARNLPEHARNPIHTDAGARAAGFPGALVAGVTTYAYLTHPVVAGWGAEWLRSGGGEVRFRSPVFDGDDLECVPALDDGPDGDGVVTVEVRVGSDAPARAVLRAARIGGPPLPLRTGEVLAPHGISLDGEWGAEYGSRAGEDLAMYDEQRIVHPAVWPALANQIVHTQVARGPWIHLRSVVRHHQLVRAGSTALVRASVVQRYERGGERAILDVQVEVDEAVVATLEHEAIVALP